MLISHQRISHQSVTRRFRTKVSPYLLTCNSHHFVFPLWEKLGVNRQNEQESVRYSCSATGASTLPMFHQMPYINCIRHWKYCWFTPQISLCWWKNKMAGRPQSPFNIYDIWIPSISHLLSLFILCCTFTIRAIGMELKPNKITCTYGINCFFSRLEKII